MTDEQTPPFPGARDTAYDTTSRLDIDYYGAFADIPPEDRARWDRARAFIDEVGLPAVNASWDAGVYRTELVQRMGELDLFVDGIEDAALTRISPLAAGLVNMELSRGDGSLGTVLAVQGGLALRTLSLFGSAEQKAQWLEPLARGTVLGAFALTEPDHGSDSVSLETEARRTSEGWSLRGAKKWIGNGASGGITFVWARVRDEGSTEDGTVRCFLVPQGTEGYVASVITGKGSLRGIHQASILLDDVLLPEEAVLPGARTFRDASTVLHATRLGVAWSALGHATACFEAALSYSRQRIQFGKPLAGFQLIQERLALMLEDLVAMQLYCRRLAELESAGVLRPTQASLGKRHNTRAARRIAATARDLLGGNGILLEFGVIQHLADIEAIHTYEGTESVQALLIGRDLTGVSAFA